VVWIAGGRTCRSRASRPTSVSTSRSGRATTRPPSVRVGSSRHVRGLIPRRGRIWCRARRQVCVCRGELDIFCPLREKSIPRKGRQLNHWFCSGYSCRPSLGPYYAYSELDGTTLIAPYIQTRWQEADLANFQTSPLRLPGAGPASTISPFETTLLRSGATSGPSATVAAGDIVITSHGIARITNSPSIGLLNSTASSIGASTARSSPLKQSDTAPERRYSRGHRCRRHPVLPGYRPVPSILPQKQGEAGIRRRGRLSSS
jgi:hypothetical protein